MFGSVETGFGVMVITSGVKGVGKEEVKEEYGSAVHGYNTVMDGDGITATGNKIACSKIRQGTDDDG